MLTRALSALVLIILFAFSPFIAVLMASLCSPVDNHSPLAAVPWLLLYTLPIGFVAFLCWLVAVVASLFRS